ncbi:MAG: sialidase family protein [Planctomycetaceae bacterium]
MPWSRLAVVFISVLLWNQTFGNPAARAQNDEVPLLKLHSVAADAASIDYASLPALPGELSVVNKAALGPNPSPADKVDMRDLRLNLHNYLAYHDDRFWCIWSDGPRVEDEPTQEIKYATSSDGLNWSVPRTVTGTPTAPNAFIARGLWLRNGELLALAAHFRGKGAFGNQTEKQLELLAYKYEKTSDTWQRYGRVYDNAINNFPPQLLPSGDWIMTRRDSRFNVTTLIGGKSSLSDWNAFPVVGISEVKGFRPDEPVFWSTADSSMVALFRDNGGSGRLFHALSHDSGKSWTTPRLSNFPNASSKLYSMQTSRGFRVLVLNANPAAGRRELYLSTSADGKTFTQLARLDIPSPPSIPQEVARIRKKFNAGIASLQYPHVIEHDTSLWIALSRGKVQTEVFRVSLNDVESLLKSTSPSKNSR